jgi:hypothetical protein
MLELVEGVAVLQGEVLGEGALAVLAEQKIELAGAVDDGAVGIG